MPADLSHAEGLPLMLTLDRDILERIIELAREYDAQTAPPDEVTSDDDGEDHALEARRSSPVALSLQRAIDELPSDEQVELVALMWVGRGTFGADEWQEACDTAAAERVHATSDYLMGSPLLGDHLENGLETLGDEADED